MEQLVFYLFATVAVAAALVVVFQRRAIYSALALIVSLFSMAILFYQLGAFFIAAIQVIVYAGAIMVLFLFVVMLIDPESEVFSLSRTKRIPLLAVPVAAIFGLSVFWCIWSLTPQDPRSGRELLISEGTVNAVAQDLFGKYVLPFEVTSILILVAVLGAVVLAKKAD